MVQVGIYCVDHDRCVVFFLLHLDFEQCVVGFVQTNKFLQEEAGKYCTGKHNLYVNKQDHKLKRYDTLHVLFV